MIWAYASHRDLLASIGDRCGRPGAQEDIRGRRGRGRRAPAATGGVFRGRARRGRGRHVGGRRIHDGAGRTSGTSRRPAAAHLREAASAGGAVEGADGVNSATARGRVRVRVREVGNDGGGGMRYEVGRKERKVTDVPPGCLNKQSPKTPEKSVLKNSDLFIEDQSIKRSPNPDQINSPEKRKRQINGEWRIWNTGR